MKQRFYTAILAIATLYIPAALAGDAPSIKPKPLLLKVKMAAMEKDDYLNPIFAFCGPSLSTHETIGGDISPGISWTKGPKGTQSYALIMVDNDFPTNLDNSEQEGKVISRDMKRKDFYYWVLFNIPVTITKLTAGQDSQGFELNGKPDTNTAYGIRGSNDYAKYFADQDGRAGIYAGYDGPCPPWNDELVHRYHFHVFALDVTDLGLEGKLTDGKKAWEAITPHILAEGEAVVKYTLDPQLNPHVFDNWHGIGR